MKSQIKPIAESVQYYLESDKAFVFYRKKNAEKVVALIQNDSQLHTSTSFDETGFVMAPFDSTKRAILLPCSETQKEFYDIPLPRKVAEIEDYQIDELEKKRYLGLVEKTVAFIQEENGDKVVTSRKVERTYSRSKIGNLFEILLNEYPEAMVYIWHHPKVGLWIGASPERMLYIYKDSFSTMALAGTQLKSKNPKWEAKEKAEQQFVTDFITDQLIPVARHLKISKPYTEFTGHLAHIRTDITGIIAYNTSLRDLIFRVHPTPAVCGTPRNIAKEYILQNEAYDRAFYAGFLGELNLNENTDLYVNLRCMQLSDTLAKIYIGGGITKDSDPNKEWEETYQKSLILAKFLS